jgi:hypothetical protein
MAVIVQVNLFSKAKEMLTGKKSLNDPLCTLALVILAIIFSTINLTPFIAALIFFSLLKTPLILSPSSKSLYVHETIHGTHKALFLHENGSHPTCAWFDVKLFSFVDRTFSGHSTRAGGATFYATLGLSELVIMALGCWSSKAWKIYICDNPCV